MNIIMHHVVFQFIMNLRLSDEYIISEKKLNFRYD